MSFLTYYQDYWHSCAEVISQMAANGVGLDVNACQRSRFETAAKVHVLLSELNRVGNSINWNSSQQLTKLLYQTLELPLPPISGTLRAVKVRQPNERPTGEAALTWLAAHCPEHRKFLGNLLAYKKASKLRQFFAALPGLALSTGRIHPQYSSLESGRWATRNPNLQQLPPAARHVITAGPRNTLICLDYSGLEWRILAHYLVEVCGDRSLLSDIEAGIDPHSATAVRMGLCPKPVETVKKNHSEARAWAKILNYSINYGKSGMGLGVQLQDKDGNPKGREFGERLLRKFYESNPGILAWHNWIKDFARERGYVESLLGRKRYLPEIKSQNPRARGAAERQALNVIQNTASDIMLLAMVRACNSPTLRSMLCAPVLNVHDELVFEAPVSVAEEAKEFLERVMRTCTTEARVVFHSPLDVSGGIGYTWKEAGGK